MLKGSILFTFSVKWTLLRGLKQKTHNTYVASISRVHSVQEEGDGAHVPLHPTAVTDRTLLRAYYTICAMYYKPLALEPRGAGHQLAASMQKTEDDT